MKIDSVDSNKSNVAKNKSVAAGHYWWCTACVMVALFLLQAISFLFILKQVGFYLDDWIMVNTLAKGPDGFLDSFKYYFSADSRVVNRPVEALHYLVMFKLFGLNPLGYHVFNGVLELLSAWLMYFCLFRVTGRRSIAFLSAALMMLFPTHNITHYWVVASSVSLSMVFYLGSLYADIVATTSNRKMLHLLSAILFGLGLFNYEVFLPLAVLNVMVVFYLNLKSNGLKHSVLLAMIPALGTGAGLLSLMAYLKFVVPMIGPAWLHQVKFDPGLMLSTIYEGIVLNLTSFSYFYKHAQILLSQGVKASDWLLLAMCLFTGLGVFYLLEGRGKVKVDIEKGVDRELLGPYQLISLGVVGLVFSYSIFGLNSEYMPTFISIVNRVNTGATIGLAFVLAGVFVLVFDLDRKTKREFVLKIIVAVFSSVCLAFFTVTNWSLAHPFIISWQVQKQVMKAVEKNAELFKSAKSILLANCPRYVNEAAVFDGIWDFQSMIKLVLKRDDIKGGVICDRLKLTSDDIKDRSPMGGYLCATHGFDDLYVIVSPVCEIVKVNNPEELIDLVESRAMQFELNKELPDLWRKQLKEDYETRLKIEE